MELGSGIQVWQAIGVVLTVIGTVTTPAIVYIKKMIADVKAQNEKDLSKMEANQQKMENIQTSSFALVRDDIKELRNFFDKTVDAKNKEIKDHVSQELTYIRNTVTEIERRVETTREKNHNIEKDLLTLRNEFNRNFITKDQLDMILQLNGKKNS